MGFDFTTSNLIDDIKRRTFMPINQITYSDTDILDYADEEIQTGIVPLLMSVREEYLVTYKEDIISTGTIGYDMPERAIAMKLKDVTVIEADSDPSNPVEISIPLIQADQGPTRLLNNYPGFFIRDNQLILQNPGAFNGKKLRQYYFLRRNRLVTTSNAAQITEIGPVGGANPLLANQVRVTVVPSSFGSSTNFNQTIDIVKNKPGFDTLELDVVANFSSNTLVVTFTALTAVPTDVVIGDWICLSGESCIPQIPVELMPILAQRVAVKILEGLGDGANLAAAQSKLEKSEKAVLGMLTQRVQGEAKKILNPYSAIRVFPWRRY